MDPECDKNEKARIQTNLEHYYQDDRPTLKDKILLHKDVQTTPLKTTRSFTDACIQVGNRFVLTVDTATQTYDEDVFDNELTVAITKSITENILSNIGTLNPFSKRSPNSPKLVPSVNTQYIGEPISTLNQSQDTPQIFDYVAAEEEVTAMPMENYLKTGPIQDSSNAYTTSGEIKKDKQAKWQRPVSLNTSRTQQSRSKRKSKPTTHYKNKSSSSTLPSQSGLSHFKMLDNSNNKPQTCETPSSCGKPIGIQTDSHQDVNVPSSNTISHMDSSLSVNIGGLKTKYHKPFCQECARSFESESEFELHMQCHVKVETEEASSNDNSEDAVESTEDVSNEHGYNTVRHQCKYCIKSYKLYTSLKKHLLEVHFQKIIVEEHSDSVNVFCDWCRESIHPNTNLNEHKLSELETDQKVHLCSVCNQQFVGSTSLHKHILETYSVNKKIGLYACKICKKKFFTFVSLVRHSRFKHKDGNMSLTCNVCGKVFKGSSRLNRHQRTHSDGGFKCEFCSETFRDKYYVKIHIRRKHTQEKPYICEICGESFVTSGNLRRHLLTHTGEKPYTCDICGEKFAAHWTCSVHKIRKHTGERNFQCDVCGRAFAYKSDLTKHIMTHNDTKPFVCEYCDKSFTGKSRLSAHMKKSHSEVEMEEMGFQDFME